MRVPVLLRMPGGGRRGILEDMARPVRRFVLVALLCGLASPAAAGGAVVPADGPYSSRAGGAPRPEVAFAMRKGRIVKPARGSPLEVEGLRCARGKDRYAYADDVTVRRGRLRGSWYSGQFDARTRKWVRGEAFEITGRWTRRGLVEGRMRFRRTVGRRCSSGWVRWKAAPIDPVSVTSAGPLTFVVPGDMTVGATVSNDGEAASKRTDLVLNLALGGSGPLASRGAEVVAIRPSQGACDPAFRLDEFGILNTLTCRLGPLAAHRRATVEVTLRWSAASCFDPETGASAAPSMQRQVMVTSSLNEAPDRRDPNEDAVPPSDGDCAGVTPPPRPPAPVDEP